jgi:hypothetical protein
LEMIRRRIRNNRIPNHRFVNQRSLVLRGRIGPRSRDVDEDLFGIPCE